MSRVAYLNVKKLTIIKSEAMYDDHSFESES